MQDTVVRSGGLDVRMFGASGDGKTLNTAALQRAIDECSKNGGGTVFFPPGEFLSGTLYLKDRVHVFLGAGAVLKASARREDYNADDAFPQNNTFSQEHVSGAHFLIGIEVSDVSITGEGVIDGNEAAFRGPLPDASPGREPVFAPAAWRPGQMIVFYESRRIRMAGLTVRNGPYWHILMHGCADVRIHGLHIHTDRRVRNGDGIDLDCCCGAVVSDCLIDSSDDCITVRANGSRLLRTDALSERIAVSNCVLRTRCCGVRVGVGNGEIRDVVFSNLDIRDAHSGITLQGRYSPRNEGVAIENVRFDNITVRSRVPLHVTSGFEGRKPIRGVFVSNLSAVCDGAAYIGGSPLQPIEDVHLDNIHFTFHGGGGNDPAKPSPYEMYRTANAYHHRAIGMPYGLFIESTQDLMVRGMRIRWRDTDGTWLEGIHCRQVRGARFRDVVVDPPPGGGSPLGVEASEDIEWNGTAFA